MRNVAMYLRAASADGAEESAQAQRSNCIKQAASDGCIVTHEYADMGWSGLDEDRPAFVQMMIDARDGAFSAIYVDEMNRLSRSHSIHWHIQGLLALGVEVIDASLPQLASRDFQNFFRFIDLGRESIGSAFKHGDGTTDSGVVRNQGESNLTKE